MAVLTVKKSAIITADLSTGWKEVTIVGAKRGQYDNNGTKYIDITFEGYPENIKLRAHQKFNKKTRAFEEQLDEEGLSDEDGEDDEDMVK